MTKDRGMRISTGLCKLSESIEKNFKEIPKEKFEEKIYEVKMGIEAINKFSKLNKDIKYRRYGN